MNQFYDNDSLLESHSNTNNKSSDLSHKNKKLRSKSESGLVGNGRFIACFDLFKFGWIFYIYIKGILQLCTSPLPPPPQPILLSIPD